MNEHEFRDALRANMSANTEPPPMSEAPVLDAAKRDRKRRRMLWAGAGSAGAVVAIAVGVVVIAPSTSNDDGGGLGVGGAPPSVTTTEGHESTPAKVPESGSEDTETQWPDGQTDRTASSGPQYDKGLALATELDAAVPDGYDAPKDLVGNGDLAGAPMWYHQAQYSDTVDGVDVWEYMADIAVTKGKGVGRLEATVMTPGNLTTGEGCGLTPGLWGMEGDCTEVAVDGKRVGVFTVANPEPGMDQFDQWASYRHDDGTVVMIGQAKSRAFTSFPPLDGLPLTEQQLAELAADPRFHLD